MAVAHMPPNSPIFHFSLLRYSNVNIILDINCTRVPKKKAIVNRTWKMPNITDRAFYGVQQLIEAELQHRLPFL